MSFNNSLNKRYQTGPKAHSSDTLGLSPSRSNRLLKSRELAFERSRNASFEERTLRLEKSPEVLEVRLEQLAEKLHKAQEVCSSKLQSIESSLGECESEQQSLREAQCSQHHAHWTELSSL